MNMRELKKIQKEMQKNLKVEFFSEENICFTWFSLTFQYSKKS
jgi:hypothetical protein